MPESLQMLDRALDLGRRELEFLLSGDIDEAEKLARERGELIHAALAPETAGRDPQALRERLEALRDLQGRITSQAVRLRDETKAELLRTKQEGRRMDGYKSGVRGGTGVQSRFVSKRG